MSQPLESITRVEAALHRILVKCAQKLWKVHKFMAIFMLRIWNLCTHKRTYMCTYTKLDLHI